MATLTTQERQEIDRANDSGLPPVVFVHGLWLLSSSWNRWRALFEEKGFTTLAPGWPDDPETVAEANQNPQVFAHKRIHQVTDHYVDAIRQLKAKPAIIGHSFGGFIAQRLAGPTAGIPSPSTMAGGRWLRLRSRSSPSTLRKARSRGRSLRRGRVVSPTSRRSDRVNPAALDWATCPRTSSRVCPRRFAHASCL